MTRILELVHGLTKELRSVVEKLRVQEDDIATRQAALDDWADLVKIGVARQHQQRRRLGMQLCFDFLQERLVDPCPAEPLGQGG